MKPLRAALAIALSALMLVAVSALSRVPLDGPDAGEALLRLSWRVRGEHLETCRKRTQAELDALPVHMRAPEVCERRLAAYHLIVSIDDAAADTQHVVPGGARGDRPVFVFRETPLLPGPHRVRIHFRRDGAAADSLSFDQVINSVPGQIDLVTVDAESGRLVHVAPPPISFTSLSPSPSPSPCSYEWTGAPNSPNRTAAWSAPGSTPLPRWCSACSSSAASLA